MKMQIEWNVKPKHYSERRDNGNTRYIALANFGISDGGPCDPQGVYIAWEGTRPLSDSEAKIYDVVLGQFGEALAEKIMEMVNKALEAREVTEPPFPHRDGFYPGDGRRIPALSVTDKDGNTLLEVK